MALATSVSADSPHLVPEARYRRIQQHVGRLAAEQLSCGFHVHVAITSLEEGVAVLNRIRVCLPVLLVLSTNSAFWYGVDTGFASYPYQAWTRWPIAGAGEIFGTVAELLELLHPVLSEASEVEQVQAVVAAILREGTGARTQRAAYAPRRDLQEVLAAAVDLGDPTTAGR